MLVQPSGRSRTANPLTKTVANSRGARISAVMTAPSSRVTFLIPLRVNPGRSAGLMRPYHYWYRGLCICRAMYSFAAQLRQIRHESSLPRAHHVFRFEVLHHRGDGGICRFGWQRIHDLSDTTGLVSHSKSMTCCSSSPSCGTECGDRIVILGYFPFLETLAESGFVRRYRQKVVL